MTTTLIIERILNHNCSFPFELVNQPPKKSYYRFYQLKLQELLLENRCRESQNAKSARPKQIKSQLSPRRIHREPMSRAREPMKAQPLNDDQYGKRSSSILSATNRRKKDSTIFPTPSASISTTLSTESRPKSISKSKQPSPSSKYERVFSAPANTQKILRKKTSIKSSKSDINDLDNNLSRSNPFSYTQVSSSSQYFIQKNHYCARQSILDNIRSHLNKHTPATTSKWDLYRDIDDKFSASISPSVYRSFERIIL